jgi:hypothetical protein
MTQRQRFGLGLALAAALALAQSMPAQPAQAGRWRVDDRVLPGPVRLLRTIAWEGAPALMALANAPGPAGGRTASLQVLRAGPGGITPAAAWTLPFPLRWVEPLRSGTGAAWLALRQDGWYIARPRGAELAWQRLCACPSVFDSGQDPDGLFPGFALDLDGDGRDELALPTALGLDVYRLAPGREVPQALLPEPLWSWRWDPPLKPDPKTRAYALPEYFLVDTRRGGRRDLVVPRGGAVAVSASPAGPPRLVLDGAARARLGALALPPALRAALAALKDGEFADGAAVWAQLPEAARSPEHLAALPGALWALTTAPALPPEVRPLPQPPRLGSGDYAFPMALQDLTGDGIPDLLQAAVLGSGLGIRGELRLYAGGIADGRWTFPRAPVPMTSQGPSVAEIVRLAAGDAAPALVVAQTEVTLGTLLKGLTSGKADVEISIYPIRGQGIERQPARRVKLAFEGIGDGFDPLVFAADLDGDGAREFLVNTAPKRLLAFAGSAQGPRLGGAPMAVWEGPLPRYRQEVLVADLDGDRREEIVFWYRPGRFGDALRSTVRVLRWVE